MHRTRPGELPVQRRAHCVGQHGHAVLVALAAAHQDLAAGEVDVLHAQVQALAEAHTGAVHERRQQPHLAVKLAEHGGDLVGGEHNG